MVLGKILDGLCYSIRHVFHVVPVLKGFASRVVCVCGCVKVWGMICQCSYDKIDILIILVGKLKEMAHFCNCRHHMYYVHFTRDCKLNLITVTLLLRKCRASLQAKLTSWLTFTKGGILRH